MIFWKLVKTDLLWNRVSKFLLCLFFVFLIDNLIMYSFYCYNLCIKKIITICCEKVKVLIVNNTCINDNVTM